MGREKEGYRDTIALLNERFPDHDLLNIAQAMEFTGYSRNTIKKWIRFPPSGKISKADLARQVCI